jgi:hypothetical protein
MFRLHRSASRRNANAAMRDYWFASVVSCLILWGVVGWIKPHEFNLLARQPALETGYSDGLFCIAAF